MLKVKARWSGFTGSPGYSVFYFREWTDGTYQPTAAEATACAVKVRTLFDQLKTVLPPTVKVQVDSDVEIIEDTNGKLVDVRSATAQAVVTGTATNTAYSAASGAVLGWQTAGVRNGRRVRGRTFIVPLTAGAYDTDGTLLSTHHTTLTTAASNFVFDTADTPTFGVFQRPSAPGATDGAWTFATGSRVPDTVAILRSRRD